MVGAFLKSTREAKGLTVRDIAERTNLMRQLVEELENEDFHRVPAVIYGRGFIKLYGQALDLEPEKIALLQNDFSLLYSGAVQPSVKLKSAPSPSREPVRPATPAQEEVPEKIKLRFDVEAEPSALAPVEEPVKAVALEPQEKEVGAEAIVEAAAGENSVEELTVEEEPVEEEQPLEPDLFNPVVEPEVNDGDGEEIDLFAHAQRLMAMRRGNAAPEGQLETESKSEVEVESINDAEEDEERFDAVAAAQARLQEATGAFLGSIKKALAAVGRGGAALVRPLARLLPRGKTILIGCAVAVAVMLLALTVRVLFAMTSSNGSFEELTVSPPPPSFYID